MIYRDKKQLAQVTHMIVPKTKHNTCDMNLECLIGIANGLFIVNENCTYNFNSLN